MSRKCVTFYPSQKVFDWIQAIPDGEKSREVNALIESGLIKKEALFNVPLNFYQMSELLAVLEASKHPLHEYFEQFVL